MKERNRNLEEKIEERKHWFGWTESEKAEKWKLKINEMTNKQAAVKEWTEVVDEIEEKAEDVLSRLQTKEEIEQRV